MSTKQLQFDAKSSTIPQSLQPDGIKRANSLFWSSSPFNGLCELVQEMIKLQTQASPMRDAASEAASRASLAVKRAIDMCREASIPFDAQTNTRLDESQLAVKMAAYDLALRDMCIRLREFHGVIKVQPPAIAYSMPAVAVRRTDVAVGDTCFLQNATSVRDLSVMHSKDSMDVYDMRTRQIPLAGVPTGEMDTAERKLLRAIPGVIQGATDIAESMSLSLSSVKLDYLGYVAGGQMDLPETPELKQIRENAHARAHTPNTTILTIYALLDELTPLLDNKASTKRRQALRLLLSASDRKEYDAQMVLRREALNTLSRVEANRMFRPMDGVDSRSRDRIYKASAALNARSPGDSTVEPLRGGGGIVKRLYTDKQRSRIEAALDVFRFEYNAWFAKQGNAEKQFDAAFDKVVVRARSPADHADDIMERKFVPASAMKNMFEIVQHVLRFSRSADRKSSTQTLDSMKVIETFVKKNRGMSESQLVKFASETEMIEYVSLASGVDLSRLQKRPEITVPRSDTVSSAAAAATTSVAANAPQKVISIQQSAAAAAAAVREAQVQKKFTAEPRRVKQVPRTTSSAESKRSRGRSAMMAAGDSDVNLSLLPSDTGKGNAFASTSDTKTGELLTWKVDHATWRRVARLPLLAPGQYEIRATAAFRDVTAERTIKAELLDLSEATPELRELFSLVTSKLPMAYLSSRHSDVSLSAEIQQLSETEFSRTAVHEFSSTAVPRSSMLMNSDPEFEAIMRMVTKQATLQSKTRRSKVYNAADSRAKGYSEELWECSRIDAICETAKELLHRMATASRSTPPPASTIATLRRLIDGLRIVRDFSPYLTKKEMFENGFVADSYFLALFRPCVAHNAVFPGRQTSIIDPQNLDIRADAAFLRAREAIIVGQAQITCQNRFSDHVISVLMSPESYSGMSEPAAKEIKTGFVDPWLRRMELAVAFHAALPTSDFKRDKSSDQYLFDVPYLLTSTQRMGDVFATFANSAKNAAVAAIRQITTRDSTVGAHMSLQETVNRTIDVMSVILRRAKSIIRTRQKIVITRLGAAGQNDLESMNSLIDRAAGTSCSYLNEALTTFHKEGVTDIPFSLLVERTSEGFDAKLYQSRGRVVPFFRAAWHELLRNHQAQETGYKQRVSREHVVGATSSFTLETVAAAYRSYRQFCVLCMSSTTADFSERWNPRAQMSSKQMFPGASESDNGGKRDTEWSEMVTSVWRGNLNAIARLQRDKGSDEAQKDFIECVLSTFSQYSPFLRASAKTPYGKLISRVNVTDGIDSTSTLFASFLERYPYRSIDMLPKGLVTSIVPPPISLLKKEK